MSHKSVSLNSALLTVITTLFVLFISPPVLGSLELTNTVMISGPDKADHADRSNNVDRPKDSTIDLVKVDKSKRRMYLLKDETIIQEFRIALGARPKGHKLWEGDQRTPEGLYKLDFIIEHSTFYRSIHIDYPNQKDIEWARYKGINPGGNIKIHGLKNGDRRHPEYVQSFDWTNGCIAITNDEMDVFLSLVESGTPILIEW
ncbi:L,D-transpeptidase family protein [Vibrio sp. YMD68]|uniref:L,D-transpeptidase family protein n=1 Tax=Vibrio sp. YMD68 TaxID=3042300 RepID=UPI00249C5E6B|nr:L,D-transpeptidase family protein [Vibrio sp. YMD68]WGV97857.1 L,D-transpeptidase family protein [Vibrio sp. YMD68]